MRFRTTLILLAIALGLGIYIGVYESSQAKPDPARDRSGALLATFDLEAVSRIVIEFGDDTTELERHQIYWIFRQPIGDRASATTVNTLLDQLSHLAIQDELRPSDLINSAELTDEALGFGDGERIRVTLHGSPDGDEPGGDDSATEPVLTTLVLGKPAPMTNTIYARVEGDPQRSAFTYVVSGTPRQYLVDSVSALRDRSLLGIPTDQVTGVRVRTAGGEVEIARRIVPPQQGWTLVAPVQFRADTAKMEQFLSRLVGLQIASVVEENPAASPLPTQVPTGAARIDLTLHGWEQPLSLYLSPRENTEPAADGDSGSSDDPQSPRLLARISSRPGIYEIRSPLLAALPDSAADFRDPYLARIPIEYLHSIQILSLTDPTVVLTSDVSSQGMRWFSSRNSKRERADNDQLKRMLNAINTGRVLDFLPANPDELENFGFNPAELKIAFNLIVSPNPADPAAAAGGEPEIQQRILQFGRPDVDTLYANFVGEPWVFQVDPSIRHEIPSHPLKWRDGQVMAFNLIGLQRLEIDRGEGSPRLQLDYDFAIDDWSGTLDDLPVNERIDDARASALAGIIGSLEAMEWIVNVQDAYQKLDEPSLRIRVTRREIDPLTNEMAPVVEELRFAKGPLGGYYGNIVGSPDVFLIAPEIASELYRPVLVP